jgi:hypothetical protein
LIRRRLKWVFLLKNNHSGFLKSSFLLDKLSGNPTQIDGWVVDCVLVHKKSGSTLTRNLFFVSPKKQNPFQSLKNREFIKSSFCVCVATYFFLFACHILRMSTHTFSATCHAGWVSKSDYAITWPRRRCIGIYFARSLRTPPVSVRVGYLGAVI